MNTDKTKAGLGMGLLALRREGAGMRKILYWPLINGDKR
jgi:hypothetical protein